MGVAVYYDSQHETHLTGWQVLLPVEQNGVIITAPATDGNGKELRLTTAEMLAYPIVEDTVFMPLWDSPKYTSFYWLTIHGNGGTFERTTEDSEKVEVRQMGYDSYPTADAGTTLKNTGILNLTDPVCPGKEFEGWVAYHHGPTDTAFGTPVTGEVLTTAYILDYASLGLGYTDFIAKWKNEDIDPNNCTINETNTLISSTPVDPTPTTYTVSIDACMGAPFNISAPPPLGNEEPSSYIGEATISVEAGTTLADLGVKVWHDDEHLPYFQGWSVYTWDPIDEYWMGVKDSDGNYVVLDTTSMLNTPIDEDIRFEPSWQSCDVYFEDVDGGTFDVSAFDSIVSDDTAKSHWVVPYMHCLDILVISDIKNGTETFYGWDVYERVEDPSDPEAYELIPLEGPISTTDVLARTITHDVVYRANWTGNAPTGGNPGSGAPGVSAPSSQGLAISGNGGTFDIVRTNPQGQPETWEDAEHTREDFDIFVGDTLADRGITDITDIKFWDGKREFLGWEVWSWLPVGEETFAWGPLYNRLFTTEEVLAHPAEESFIEFVAVWAGDDADYYTNVDFDAVGGKFSVTEFDYTENGPVAIGTVLVEGIGNLCKENGQTYAEQLEADCYPNADPVREGYTFEGWLAVNQDYRYTTSSKLYTTEEIVKLPIPADNTSYMAKWKEIPVEEYLYGAPHYPYDGSYSDLYLLANGGTFNCSVTYEEDGQTVTDTFTDSWLPFYTEGDMTFEEFQDEYGMSGYTFELADKTNFEGWTTYSADMIYYVELMKGDTLNVSDESLTVMKAGENVYGVAGETTYTEVYLLLKNAKVYSTTMTPEEALKLKGDKFYTTVAQWHTKSDTLANVKAATCTAEGYSGDTVCASCGEILEKGKAVAKTAHVASATLANVKAAACSAEGYSGDTVCASCGEILEKGKAVAKTAHIASPNLANVKSATHTEEGYSGDTVCANCGEILERGKTIDKIKETVSTPVIKEESKTSVDSQIGDVVAVISGEKTEETQTVLTEGTGEAIEEAVTNGHSVGADIVFERITPDELTGEEQESFQKEAAAIESKAVEEIGTNAIVAEFIDISVIVKNRTTGEDLGNITELDEPVMIEFRVPAALQAENREFYIIHYHDGKADLIKGDYKDGVLTISADKFSTYALVYVDVTETTPDPSIPATGDQSSLMLFTTLLLMAAAGIYLTSRKLRRV